jgi:hypothetical protein
MPLKVMRIEDAPVRVMRWDRGKALRLVDEADGAKNVDVHINLINVDSGPGPTHYHAKAENIYVVLEGNVEAIVEGKKYRLGPGDTRLAIAAIKSRVSSRFTHPRARISTSSTIQKTSPRVSPSNLTKDISAKSKSDDAMTSGFQTDVY